MKNILLATLLLLGGFSLAQAEVKKAFDDSGKLKYERNYENGKLHGISRGYYPSGKLKVTSSFYNGLAWGDTIGYYENGKVKASIPFVKGKVEGVQKEFYNNGQLKSSQRFEKDIPVGTKRVYFPDGNMKARINFNDKGQMSGTAKEYRKGGLLKYTIKLEDGKAIKGYLYDKKGNRTEMTSQDFNNMGLQEKI